jgi:indole-3-glycerol phosphate synthase
VSDFLEEVSLRTKDRVAVQKQRVPMAELQRRAANSDPLRPFLKALQRPGHVAIIAELKQASPSAGVIRKEDDLEGRIRGYTKGGAAALSILTEEYFFHGSPHILELARKTTTLPLLRKDFIIDSYQIYESRMMGADALLLIAAILPGAQLRDLIGETRQSGMDALVEVHDERELNHALEAGARLIGVNNRNLHTLRVDVSTAKRLVPRIPKQGNTIVIESGVKEPAELSDFAAWGAHAALIGETLMRHPDPEAVVRSFAERSRS